ncbi:hypothetical protein F4808DRAFT_436762 [Astrocystis sublimbata]|nr:hypothetical protein F4808DRAFT_436762 [Astrocystis sublimbata]
MNAERRRLLNRPILLAIPIIIGLFITRSPLLMTSTTPSPSAPWADAPLALITTPQYATKQMDLFTTGATHMALLHNSIFRGYNSIWQQAPHVKDVDKIDFIGYALTWYKFVKSHHDDEEESLFGRVEEVLDDKTIWEGTHEEHQAFLPGLAQFHTYLTTLRSPKDFSGTELRRIMSTFQESFSAHFHSEIATISALASHPNAPPPGSEKEAEASLVFKTWGKSTVTKAGTLDVVPFFLLNLDGTVEEGLWENWPPIPWPVKWGLVNVGGAYHNRWWKFASCAGGRPRGLYAVEGK